MDGWMEGSVGGCWKGWMGRGIINGINYMMDGWMEEWMGGFLLEGDGWTERWMDHEWTKLDDG